jgi:hypothetical protein
MKTMDLAVEDIVELAEMLDFLHDWLGGADADLLAASLRRFMDTDGYDLPGLRSELSRFTFLIGGSDGDELFEPEQA